MYNGIFIDFILAIDQYMIDTPRISYLGLCHTVYNHFLRNGIGCHSIPPRDSLLFVAEPFRLCPCLRLIFSLWFYLFLAVLGDSCNYMIGHFLDVKLF